MDNLIELNNDWLKSFDPIRSGSQDPLILNMENAAFEANVGPMAAVAGAIADLITEDLMLKGAKHIVVENGGDIAVKANQNVQISLFSETSFLGNKYSLSIPPNDEYLGIASSSGTYGHAISLGNADIVTIIAKNATLADAAATAIANEVVGDNPDEAIQRGIDRFKGLNKKLFFGVIINKKDKIGLFGKIPKIKKIINSES